MDGDNAGLAARATPATAATRRPKTPLPVAPVARIATPSFNRDEWEERAAIIEYDGGLPRSEAERLAAEGQGMNIEKLLRRTVPEDDVESF